MPFDTTIEINGLRLYARHGVMEQERLVGNEFEVTVHLKASVDEALTDDDLSATINYADVVELIRQLMSQPSRLLEHVAYRIKCAITDRYPKVIAGMIRVAKLTPPIPADMDSVAVVIRW